ncbi:hypothetical protein HanXRQr2_Chr04g0156451 [Helianthus annuus]|uniref:Uncharacterized protein n=1 Tax=Helianthus annuus TaxID=4232 RepID=A0A251TJC9_HELAN|nr:hypothetical protein HanXRQr2_Chr04g0156451 [Helianthus annuus]
MTMGTPVTLWVFKLILYGDDDDDAHSGKEKRRHLLVSSIIIRALKFPLESFQPWAPKSKGVFKDFKFIS